MSLPTYEQANSAVGALELVAPYIPLHNLPRCCLVSKTWRSTFMPALWAEPTRVSCSAPAAVTPAFTSLVMARRTRFLSSILAVSRDTRSLVSALDLRLPTRLDEEFPLRLRVLQGKPASLLDALLHVFPALKFILADGLVCRASPSLQAPAACSSLPCMDAVGQNVASSANVCPILLSAQRTDLSVAQVMRTESLRSLLYLDISYLSKTGSCRGLFSRDSFPHLRVLKLRGLRLNDADLFDVLSGFKNNLWSLDVRDNYLTDSTAVGIARLALPRRLPPPQLPSPLNQTWYEEDPPVYYASERQEAFDHRIKTPFRADGADQIMRTLQEYPNELRTHGPTTGLGPSIPLAHITGLTNLHISNNKLTSKGVETIIETNDRLQFLDVGTVRQEQGDDLSIGMYKATIKLPSGPRTDLEHLRIHHSLATGIPTASTNRHSAKTVRRCESLASAEEHLFNPHSNPSLRHLTLTNVPLFTFGVLIDRLTLLLQRAAVLEARCRPPQRPSKHGPQMKTGLLVVELEFETLNGRDGASVSGDPDADEFVLQSAGDFSFFNDGDVGAGTQPSVDDRQGLRDVVEELKMWRKKVKREREVELERVGGRADLMRVEAHYCWSGALKLVS